MLASSQQVKNHLSSPQIALEFNLNLLLFFQKFIKKKTQDSNLINVSRFHPAGIFTLLS